MRRSIWANETLRKVPEFQIPLQGHQGFTWQGFCDVLGLKSLACHTMPHNAQPHVRLLDTLPTLYVSFSISMRMRCYQAESGASLALVLIIEMRIFDPKARLESLKILDSMLKTTYMYIIRTLKPGWNQ